jgi:high-affinity iron transporter
MLPAVVIGFREGLEAALIVGIVIGYLVKIDQRAHIKMAWAGVGAAALASALVAVGITLVGAELVGRPEQIFEGTTMFLAVAVLTWMIFWMRTQARALKTSLEKDIRAAVSSGVAWGLFWLAFVAVFREGVETALLLSASAFTTAGASTFSGAVLGLALAMALGWAIYASTVGLNVSLFFNVTSVLLLFFAAGLLTNGVREFQEASLLPLTIAHVWDMRPLLNEESVLGEILKALFGYNGSPSLLEVITYVGYWVVALVGVRWWVERRAARVEARQA